MDPVKQDLYPKPDRGFFGSWQSAPTGANQTENCGCNNKEAGGLLMVPLPVLAGRRQPTTTAMISRPTPMPPSPRPQSHPPTCELTKSVPCQWVYPDCFDAGPLVGVNPAHWPMSAPCYEALMEATRAAGLMGQNYADEERKPLRQRRNRANYTTTQLRRLEQAFRVNQYPDVMTRETLADELDLIESRVQVWFQNRRAKHRRTRKEGSDSI